MIYTLAYFLRELKNDDPRQEEIHTNKKDSKRFSYKEEVLTDDHK